jgi:hypothetical protein
MKIPRRISRPGGRHETRREGEDVPEECPIGEAQRQRIGTTIRESRHRDTRGIDGVSREDLVQGGVDEFHVQPEAAADHVPGRSARFGRENKASKSLRRPGEKIEHLRGNAAGAVEGKDQRCGPANGAVRNQNGAVAHPADA